MKSYCQIILPFLLILFTNITHAQDERSYKSPKGYARPDISGLSEALDPSNIRESQSIDYDDPVEVQMAYLMCSLELFQGSVCRKVLKVCLVQKAKVAKDLIKGNPWLCEDGRFIREFL